MKNGEKDGKGKVETKIGTGIGTEIVIGIVETEGGTGMMMKEGIGLIWLIDWPCNWLNDCLIRGVETASHAPILKNPEDC